MIRLPATGISLSDNDINFHLQQIDIYHGLLRQGFKKNEILRYFKEHQAAQKPSSRPCSSLGSPSLSTVELAARSHGFKDPLPAQEENTLLSSPIERSTNDVSPSSSADPHSVTQAHRHAPRQSSLLRFAQALPSSSPSAQTERASESDVETKPEALESKLVSPISRLYLGSQNDAEPRAKGPTAIPRRWAEAEPFVPASQRESTARPSSGNDLAGMSPSSVIVSEETVAPVDLPRFGQTSSNMPSSPPTIPAVEQDEPIYLPMSTTPPMAYSSTSIHQQQQQRCVLTEPRMHGQQHLEEATFPVYNDGLPVGNQPQTPADLVRTLLVTEEEAAYTAPPGALHMAVPPGRRSRLTVVPRGIDQGEDHSPVALAMDGRERRTRELMRTVRAERMRMQRQLQYDRDVIARGLDGGTETSGGRDHSGPVSGPEFWREDFEGDRVGDENWEA